MNGSHRVLQTEFDTVSQMGPKLSSLGGLHGAGDGVIRNGGGWLES